MPVVLLIKPVDRVIQNADLRPISRGQSTHAFVLKFVLNATSNKLSVARILVLEWLRGHSTPTSHLGDKADFTPSPLIGSGSNRGCLTGETYDVVRSYGICSYRAGFSHPPYAPSKPLQPRRENGAERNRTAVRNTGVDHLVRSRTDFIILASKTIQRSTRRTTHAAMLLQNSIKG